MDIVEQLDTQLQTVPAMEYEVMRGAKVEIVRLRQIIQRAKNESVLIDRDGQTMLAIPYWFMRSS